MIGKIKGVVDEVLSSAVIIDVNGVGYLVNSRPERYLEGQSVEVYIFTAVKENDISLWGFDTKQELSLFKLLIGVSGVGQKTGYSLVTEHGVAGVVSAIINEDPAGLKIPGVGTKTAERIIIDLRNKIEKFGVEATTGDHSAGKTKSSKVEDEVVDALMSLGYKSQEIKSAIAGIEIESYQSLSTEDLIKLILTKV